MKDGLGMKLFLRVSWNRRLGRYRRVRKVGIIPKREKAKVNQELEAQQDQSLILNQHLFCKTCLRVGNLFLLHVSSCHAAYLL